uniref:DUF19 domain-containing protein n=1 Tax=Strigamia maritima TaxID=126957 RepID=T1J9I5_STRMM
MNIYTIYMILQVAYSKFVYGEKEPKALEPDPGCLDAIQMNLKRLNQLLTECQKPTKLLPAANLEGYVNILCENLEKDAVCYEQHYKMIKHCLESKPSHKFYVDKIHEFNAGRMQRCDNAKQTFRDFHDAKGRNCMVKQNISMGQCEKLKYTEKWNDLKTMEFPPEVKIGQTVKTSVNKKECRKKGIWLTCMIGKLQLCSDKTAARYYRGYYGAMMTASNCLAIIQEEFPSLVYSVYGDNKEMKLLQPDPGCLNEYEINLDVLNDRLTRCQKPKEDLPAANLEKYVSVLCGYLQEDKRCYKEIYSSFKKCLETSTGHKFYYEKLREFEAGRVHRCENAKKTFRDFNSRKGATCMNLQKDSLSQCDKLRFSNKWNDLKSMEFPPEVAVGQKQKTGVDKKECRSV